MKSIVLVALELSAFLLLLTGGCSRGKEEVVAEGSGVKIVVADFKERYQSFLASGGKRDNIVARKEVLSNMMNEQLIYKDLNRLGIDRDATAMKEKEEIRNQALLDGYTRRFSTDTMTVSDAELREEFRIHNSKVSARYLYASSMNGARELKRKLEQGATFQALARDVFEDPGLANNGGYLGYFSSGEMEPALEDAAFSLPVGSVSDPLRLTVGYAILRVEDRVANPLTFESDFAKIKEDLDRTIRHKKTVRLLREVTDEIYSELQPSFNEHAVASVVHDWNYVTDSTTGAGEDLPSVRDISGQELVRFATGTWTVNEVLHRAVATMKRQQRRVKTPEDLKDFVLGLATRDVLLSRSRAAGLVNDEMVQGQIKKNTQAYLLRKWRGTVQDSVGQQGWDEKELRHHFNKDATRYQFPPEVNVAEILVRTRPEAERLLHSAVNGAEFAELARKNSIRLWAAKRGGELGFASKATYGILGEKFFAGKVGAVLGPEFVDPYFGVFKILERREGRAKSFDEARPDIIKELSFIRKQEVFKKALEDLGHRYPLTMNVEALANIVLEQSR